MSQAVREIRVYGAKTHNLKNIDVAIPRQKLTVITGVSGSGKSSLAFDTIFREGQRRYLETLSMSSRTSFPNLITPNVDSIEGLPPVIGISQRGRQFQLRSTVSTLTEIDDHLRVLFANAGTPFCPNCEIPVHSTSVANIVREVLQGPERQKLMILAEGKNASKTPKEQVASFQKDGFVRVRVGDEILDLADAAESDIEPDSPIAVVVDRIILKEGVASRLQESIETAVRVSGGSCIVSILNGDTWQDQTFSTTLRCANCSTPFEKITPQSLSFRNSRGACPECEGLGFELDKENRKSRKRLRDLMQSSMEDCSTCNGSRLNPQAAGVRILGISLAELNQHSIESATGVVDGWQSNLDEQTDGHKTQLLRTVLPKIHSRLRFLQDVGLGYLTLNRAAGTLSGGEFQRTRLAACLGTSLTGVCYILDEPTNGLHVADTQKLVDLLLDVRRRGNTLIAVEHQLDFIAATDHIVDLGLGAGQHGGQVIAHGTPGEIANSPDSITGGFLRDKPDEVRNTPTPSDKWLFVKGADLHNLKNIDARFPLNRLTCVTGVSGSGKSSLVMGTLAPAMRMLLEQKGGSIDSTNLQHVAGIDGWESHEGIVVVDQSPIGKNNRSCPATLTGIWNDLRRLFAKTKMARLRGYTPRRFSFNSPEGRCEHCQGLGTTRLQSPVSSQNETVCPACRGLRFNPLTLAVQFRNKSVGEILRMTIEEATGFFANIERIRQPLSVFNELGLGYLQLGQPASTLSGGESQRAKLVAGLSRSMRNHLIIMDEPSQGLHPADIEHLKRVFQQLLEDHNTVICIEHNMQLIRQADWIIDLGPEGGNNGGEILDEGTPEQIAKSTGKTANALRQSWQAGDW